MDWKGAFAAAGGIAQKVGGAVAGFVSGCAPDEELEVGRHRVRIKDKLGEGGYAFVYLCCDVYNESKLYALKRMQCADREQEALADKEIKVMTMLPQHKNIARLLDHSKRRAERGYEVFLLLEYCDRSLTSLLDSRSLSETQIIDIFQQVCKGVQHMHSCRPPLAHRDLKIENVLRGQDGRWKVADLGSATTRSKVYTSKVEIADEEERVQRFSTPQYRAPEMCDLYSQKRISEKVDIWALGCMLYVMCFRKHAFPEGNSLAIVNGKYSIPKGERSESLVQLVQYCMRPDPDSRPSIEKVLDKLQGGEIKFSRRASVDMSQNDLHAGQSTSAPVARLGSRGGRAASARGRGRGRPDANAARPAAQKQQGAGPAAVPGSGGGDSFFDALGSGGDAFNSSAATGSSGGDGLDDLFGAAPASSEAGSGFGTSDFSAAGSATVTAMMADQSAPSSDAGNSLIDLMDDGPAMGQGSATPASSSDIFTSTSNGSGAFDVDSLLADLPARSVSEPAPQQPQPQKKGALSKTPVMGGSSNAISGMMGGMMGGGGPGPGMGMGGMQQQSGFGGAMNMGMGGGMGGGMMGNQQRPMMAGNGMNMMGQVMNNMGMGGMQQTGFGNSMGMGMGGMQQQQSGFGSPSSFGGGTPSSRHIGSGKPVTSSKKPQGDDGFGSLAAAQMRRM